MRIVLIVSVLLVACGGALSEMDVQRRREDSVTRTSASLQQSRDRYLAANRLQLVSSEELGPYRDSDDPATSPRPVVTRGAGISSSETIVEVPAIANTPPRLAFRYPSPCGGGCECDMRTQYALARSNDGSIVVLRLVGTDHVSRVRQEGRCGHGCGMQMAPQPPILLALPTQDASRVRVADVPYDRYLVEVTCDHMIAVP
jgi:hypothetical protein